MKTRLLKTSDSNVYQVCAKALREDGIVAFPTETIYGLGANALSTVAVHKIYKAKSRPADNPLIIHIASLKEISKYVYTNETANRLIENFWPGPLSLVLFKKDIVPSQTSAGLDTIAVRMPDHEFTLKLIDYCGFPIAAPSANISGKPSPTSFIDVYEDMNEKVDVIVDGGDSRIGLESTVVDVSGKNPTLLRPGGVSFEQLSKILPNLQIHNSVLNTQQVSDTPISPGMKYKHYSPKAQVILVQSSANLEDTILNYKNFCLITFRKHLNAGKKTVHVQTSEALSKILFRVFRECDRDQIKFIIVEAPNPAGIGLALLNRLRKAASLIM